MARTLSSGPWKHLSQPPQLTRNTGTSWTPSWSLTSLVGPVDEPCRCSRSQAAPKTVMLATTVKAYLRDSQASERPPRSHTTASFPGGHPVRDAGHTWGSPGHMMSATNTSGSPWKASAGLSFPSLHIIRLPALNQDSTTRSCLPRAQSAEIPRSRAESRLHAPHE